MHNHLVGVGVGRVGKVVGVVEGKVGQVVEVAGGGGDTSDSYCSV